MGIVETNVVGTLRITPSAHGYWPRRSSFWRLIAAASRGLRTNPKIIFFLLAFLPFAASSSAQDTTKLATENATQDATQPATQHATQDLSEASLEELANITVYTASRRTQKVTDAPSSVTVITRDEIQKYGYRTLADILRSVRGFNVTYDREYTYVGVSGINRPEGLNNSVLLLIDGHRFNDDIYGQALLGPEFPIDIDLIERVEIVRGPSSSLYGTSAFLAVINVITRKPDQHKGWELEFAPASFGTYQGRVSYGGSYHGLDMLLSGGFDNSLGQTLFFPEFNTPATDNGIARNCDYESYQHFLATVSFHGLTLRGVYGARTKGIPEGAVGTLFDDPQTQTFDSLRYFDLDYQRPIAEGWDLEARTAVSRHLYTPSSRSAPRHRGILIC